jgi:thymidylate synthase (FAD)
MGSVKPEVYIVGETQTDVLELQRYLSDIGAPDWSTDSVSGAEVLSEVMGRLCYRSFDVALNRNLTRIREGNKTYLGNVISSQHGSVFEHASVNFIFRNVTRVATHELVRHRAGTAISQESLRFVRLDKLDYFIPSCITNSENPEIERYFREMFNQAELFLERLNNFSRIDSSGNSFTHKKELTSAFRRIVPDGITTTIGWSANFRTLRHVIELRTSRHAEEEIRILFAEVAKKCFERWPNLFQDHAIEEYNGINEIRFDSKKI